MPLNPFSSKSLRFFLYYFMHMLHYSRIDTTLKVYSHLYRKHLHFPPCFVIITISLNDRLKINVTQNVIFYYVFYSHRCISNFECVGIIF